MSTLYDRASIISGRSMTRSKSVFKNWARYAEGAYIYDEDNNKYLDMLCALGAVSLGYGATYVHYGVLSLPHVVEVDAAESVLEHVAPWASSVRFTKTGSEATHAAYRIAKKATGRKRVIMDSQAYHGWHEWCQEGYIGKYEHGAQFIESEHWSDLAAIFVEPQRFESVYVDWLRSVRAFCDRVGALLVFDSMIYGGRWALGGASEYFGVTPDLECYGKAFGNGQSVAFIVGNQALAEHGEMVSGTYSGDCVGLTAVVDTLNTYTTEPVIQTLWERGRQLQRGLREVIPREIGVVEGAPVHQRIQFVDPTHGEQFRIAMKQRGILWHPAVTNIMYAHTISQMEYVIESAAESVKELR